MSASLPTPDAIARCENCGAALAGAFCAQCGQSRHNPMRHLAHAVEEVFESFWHLDGRVFRTLRDLLVPGKVAAAYIAGHRVRYVAPLRLFLVLSVLAFFLAQSVVHFDRNTVQLGVVESPAFARATTVAEVERLRDTQLRDLEQARATSPNPMLSTALDRAADGVRRAARARIDVLEGRTPSPSPSPDALDVDTDAGGVQPTADNPFGMDINGRAWHPQRNPYVIEGWPRLTRLANAELDVAARNLVRIQEDPDLLKSAVVRSIPAALLLMLPVFALLLKLLYLRRGRGYLEHVVVGLYSHAFACVVVLGVGLLTLAQDAAGSGLLDGVLGLGKGALWTWLPLYLLLMQKRVYGQDWLRTGAKFAVLGSVYALLLLFALGPLMVLGVLRA